MTLLYTQNLWRRSLNLLLDIVYPIIMGINQRIWLTGLKPAIKNAVMAHGLCTGWCYSTKWSNISCYVHVKHVNLQMYRTPPYDIFSPTSALYRFFARIWSWWPDVSIIYCRVNGILVVSVYRVRFFRNFDTYVLESGCDNTVKCYLLTELKLKMLLLSLHIRLWEICNDGEIACSMICAFSMLVRDRDWCATDPEWSSKDQVLPMSWSMLMDDDSVPYEKHHNSDLYINTAPWSLPASPICELIGRLGSCRLPCCHSRQSLHDESKL